MWLREALAQLHPTLIHPRALLHVLFVSKGEVECSMSFDFSDASTYVVLTDTLGNSISGLKPYSTATGASIENVRSELQALIDDIVANGNTPILFETTFRDYDVNGVSSIDDESLSSLPFQQDILYPIVQSMLPAQWSETL